MGSSKKNKRDRDSREGRKRSRSPRSSDERDSYKERDYRDKDKKKHKKHHREKKRKRKSSEPEYHSDSKYFEIKFGSKLGLFNHFNYNFCYQFVKNNLFLNYLRLKKFEVRDQRFHFSFS